MIINRLRDNVLLVLVAALVCFASCSSKNVDGSTDHGFSRSDGWVDESTFMIAAAGVPTRTLTDIKKREQNSLKAAIINARHHVIERFKAYGGKDSAEMENFEMTGNAVAQELRGIVERGSVHNVTWDKDQNCSIYYRVTAPGLKKKVTIAKWD